jgi:membrane-associated phospholipid phosphatase
MKWFLVHQSKVVIFILIAVCIIQEWRKGYFHRIVPYVKTRPWFPVIRLFLVFFCLALLMMPADFGLRQIIQTPGNRFLTVLGNFGRMISRDINPWFVMIACYGFGLLARRLVWSQIALDSLLSSAITVVLSQAFKFSFLRARPFGGYGPYSFFNLDGLLHDEGTFQSFPSGDVAVIAGAAAFLFCAARGRFWRWAIMIFPVATAISRISLDRHWPSDTFFSIGLGFVAARLILDYRSSLTKDASGKP